MKIAIIGAGKIGSTAARQFLKAGHDVVVSNSRDPETLSALVAELGDGARAMSVTDAAQWGEIVMLAIPFRNPEGLPPADAVAGKIVIDAMNPYVSPGGAVIDLGGTTSSEVTQGRLKQARIVRAFNTIWFKHLGERARPDLPSDERHAIPVASDDKAAKDVVMRLVEQVGFGAVDNGGLAEGARRQQPNGPLYNQVMTPVEMRAAIAKTA
jgi:predicted dinucleotide-binding enzyme